MEPHDFLRSRRSVRRFQPDAIPRDTIDRIVLTATHAPSAHNRQPWRFAVVTSPDVKSRLADSMAADYRRDLLAEGTAAPQAKTLVERSRLRIKSAPLVIVLCMDVSDMDDYPDSRRSEAERAMAVQSTANAGATLLLAAHAEGLGGVWNCSPLFAPTAVVAALNLPSSWEPQAMFLIGRTAAAPQPRNRKPVREVVVFL